MPRPKTAMPAYRFCVPGPAVVPLDGEDFYPGQHNSADSNTSSLTPVAQHQRNGSEPPEPPTYQKEIPVMVDAVAADFRESRLASFDRTPAHKMRFATLCILLNSEYGDDSAVEFGPRKLPKNGIDRKLFIDSLAVF